MRNTRALFYLALMLVLCALTWRGSRQEFKAASPGELSGRSAEYAALPGSPFLPQTRQPSMESGRYSTPFESAREYLEAHREEWGLKAYHEFRPVEYRTPLGSYIKFSVFENGIPILNLDIEMELDKSLKVTTVKNNYRDISRTVAREALPFTDIVKRVEAEYQTLTQDETQRPVLFVGEMSATPELAYVLDAKEKNGARRPVQLVIRASDGTILTQSFSRTEF
jgi:hypothetical protein